MWISLIRSFADEDCEIAEVCMVKDCLGCPETELCGGSRGFRDEGRFECDILFEFVSSQVEKLRSRTVGGRRR